MKPEYPILFSLEPPLLYSNFSGLVHLELSRVGAHLLRQPLCANAWPEHLSKAPPMLMADVDLPTVDDGLYRQ